MRRSLPLWASPLMLAVVWSTGCGVFAHTHPVEDQISKAPLKESTQQGLIDSINQQAEAIRSLKATVDIDSSAGGLKKGQVTDYKEIRGYVLARKPASLRMIGLMPIVRTTAFDMVSDGQQFKVWIPPKNRFVVGRNEVPSKNADQPIENLRPQNINDALLIRPVDPETEIAVMENSYETMHDAKGHRILQEDYELIIIRKQGTGGKLSRKIVFGRTDLKPHRQFIYDDDGNLVTDARYAEYKDFDSVNFPSKIEIFRPQEEYDITLNLLKLEINQPLADEQFQLDQPPGVDVIHLDRPQSSLMMQKTGARD